MRRKIFPWVVSIILFVFALSFFPSWAGGIFLIAGLISLPIEKVREFFASRGLKGAVKWILIVVMFFAGCVIAPTAQEDDTAEENPSIEIQQEPQEEEKEEPEEEPQESTEPQEIEDAQEEPEIEEPAAEEPKEEPQQEPQEEHQEEPTPEEPPGEEPTPDTVTEPSPDIQQEEPIESEPSDQPEQITSSDEGPGEKLVWVSEDGNRYHDKSTCSNMENPWQVTVSEAKAMGRTPCGRCKP